MEMSVQWSAEGRYFDSRWKREGIKELASEVRWSVRINDNSKTRRFLNVIF
jgi:hypothetical protein